MRRLVLLVVLTLAITACSRSDSNLGRAVVECDIELESLTTTAMISAQAVPTASFVPCVKALRPGWDFQHVAPESGRTWFAIDSDRLGSRFVQVTFTETCTPGNAVRVTSDEPSAELFVEVTKDLSEVELAIIPIAPRHLEYAHSVATALTGNVIGGFLVEATVDESEESASARISAAQQRGVPILIVDDNEVETATVSMREEDGDEETGLSVEAILDELEGSVGEPAYQATWFYVFGEDSCTRYDIDASGPGAEDVEEDVRQALGFYDLTDVRKWVEDEGYKGVFR